jgi:translocation and assembly module TamB
LRAVLRLLLIAASGLLLLLLTPLLVFWFWASGDSSLATTLTYLPRWLPAGQTLQVRDVDGSLARGGRIGWLHWQHDGLSVQAQQVQVGWIPGALWQRELLLPELSIGKLLIEDRRPPKAAAPSPVPTDLSLPFKVRAKVQLGGLTWASDASQHFGALGFSYIFDSYKHILEKGYAHILSNKYSFAGELQAHGDLAMALTAEGQITSPVPGSSELLEVAAQAQLQGSLAGRTARLALQASLKPELRPASAAARHSRMPLPMQAHLTAQLSPWQPQIITQAQGEWQGLNLATLWPQLPQTQLDGTLSVHPEGQTWRANLTARNTRTGPLDQQRLPVQSLDAQLSYAKGSWLVRTLQAQVAGGSVSAQGQLQSVSGAPDLAHWQTQLQLSAINLAAIDSRLPQSAIGGQITARQVAQNTVFELALRGPGNKLPALGLPLPQGGAALQLLAKGMWSAPQLRLSQLQLIAGPTQLQAQLDYHSVTQATAGQLSFALPGLNGRVEGQWGRTDGAGSAALHLTDAASTSQWLTRWPMLTPWVRQIQFSGNADLKADWQGGWQHQGRDLSITAQLDAPVIAWSPMAAGAAAQAVAGRSRHLAVQAAGSLANLRVQGHGDLDLGAQSLTWQTALQLAQSQTGAWQALLQQLDLDVRLGQLPQRWQLSLGTSAPSAAASKTVDPPPLVLDWVPGTERNTLTVSAGSASIRGPMAGNGKLRWQPIHWTRAVASPDQTTPMAAAPQWQSQGRIDGLPLAWIELLGGKTLADLGLGSDLLFAGHWEAAQTETLHASLVLERSAGDLRLLPGTVGEQVLPAGMRETRLQLNLDADRLAANLRWDSQQAGRALLAFSTQLQQSTDGWRWAGTAPVGGSLQLDLPPMEAWSVLAPPGWRLRGTMDAHVNLEGTLDQPLWSGSLQAQDLAVRSLVDGIDFSQGNLSARLHDQQLDISRFTLRGAGASSAQPAGNTLGGELSITGSARLLPGSKLAENGLHLQLQAQAQSLRVSARPDRRVTVSGKLGADLQNAHLSLRGTLKADQALLTLPDDSTPQLGADVVVRGAAANNVNPVAVADKSALPRGGQTRRLSVDLQVDLDAGEDFQVRGKGVETRLAGKLKLAAKDISQPTLSGTLRTVSGTYRTYGQRLDIERGLIRFNGAADNPALNVLAIRPKLSQRVGVQISGTALAPIVALYADPDLPETEKLGWLLLGRSPTGEGAEAALLQQAAIALLDKSGQGLTEGLTQALGLDEISFGTGSTTSTGENSTSTTNAASLTLGKRLSKDFYVAYESSFNGAMGVIHIFYDLSRNLTLRAQTGEQSAVDLIYTLRYD